MELLYHYTNIDGLRGILGPHDDNDDVKLWFTNAGYLNDVSEGDELDRIYKKVCIAVSYTHLDVYKRQGDLHPQKPHAAFPGEGHQAEQIAGEDAGDAGFEGAPVGADDSVAVDLSRKGRGGDADFLKGLKGRGHRKPQPHRRNRQQGLMAHGEDGHQGFAPLHPGLYACLLYTSPPACVRWPGS